MVLTIIMTLGLFTVANAAEKVTERPDIQIIIDGVKSSYTNTPIIVNGRTLLPLRELLTNLGVANDDTHIVWNSKENSVTAIKDATKLYLKVGATTAKINDKEVTIDVAPVNYKGRVYIPAKFAAEAFDKVVAWDSIANRIYMRDTTQYNEVKTTLEKSVALMDGLKRFKEYADYKCIQTAADGEETDLSSIINGQTDLEKKIAYVTDTYDFGVIDIYIIDKYSYMRMPNEIEWEKETDEYFNEHYLDLNEVIFAALSIDKSQNNKIILKGNVSLDYAIEKDPTITAIDFDSSYSEVVIDKTTGYIIQYHTIDKVQVSPTDEEPFSSVDDITCNISDFNGNFTIKVPAELQ